MSEPLPPVPGPNAPAEPLITVGSLVAAAVAVLALLVAFGVDLDDDRQAAILGVVAVVAPFVVAVAGRAKVWSPDAVRKLMQRQGQV